ncbi:glycosyltransferase family 9 protein [Salidesulfovibrio onnuriiensis]|uniref:glycosyltransferase family 9 protein n=1 Tax=Salidesulfovibrio onnuriiensis TaxID=2583823 RepID=UPI0011C91668|nr:glycosyltransferase family 9 protein [Salidesulfovibrio onnuriiensis]
MYEKNLEPLLEAFGARGMPSLMLTPGHLYPSPCRVPQVFIQPEMDIVAAKGILGPTPRFSEEAEGLEECIQYLNSSGNPGADMTLSDLRKGMGHVFRYATLFGKKFDSHQATAGFLVDFQGVAGMGFILACKRRGLPVIVVQHGMQPKNSALYSQWTKVPENGYELLPDFFWVRSRADAAKFNDWIRQCPGRHEVIVGGDHFQSLWLEGQEDFVKSHDELIRKRWPRTKGRTYVLIALNGVDEEEDRKICELIEYAIDRATGHHFWIRSHPCRLDHAERLKNKLSERARNVCFFAGVSELPLYAFLRHADAVVTMFSSVAADAAAFGLKTVYLDPKGDDIYVGMLPPGFASYADTPERVMQVLRSAVHSRKSMGKKGSDLLESGIQRILDRMEYGEDRYEAL